MGVGALNWLPDIKGWARVVSEFLKLGGVFYIYEAHPMMCSLAEDTPEEPMSIAQPYFETPEPANPEGWDFDETYTRTGEKLKNTRSYEWNHGLGETVTALIDAGLQIEFLHEHQELPWLMFPWMVEDDDGMARVPNHPERLPLSWSVRALQAT